MSAAAVTSATNDFVALISHELRTPLSSIIGYLELVRDDEAGALSDSQRLYLDVAERNAHRLLRLVGDLLFTAQVESGTFHLDETRVELHPILKASLESISPLAATAGVALRSDFSADAQVSGDAVRLSQAVDNLLSNAVKFTPRGGSVTLSVTATADDAVITVTDTGIGIAETELDKLFARFFRASTAKQGAVPGVGLGLTITKAIVAAHHGLMSVRSVEGVGTSFSITLPLAAAEV